MSDDESGRLDELFSGVEGAKSLDPASELKGQIAALLWEKRYEEALELLYAARWKTPDAAEISRGINLLKERLVRRYVEELGDLDAVPSMAPGVNRATLEIPDEERALLHLIDGISSFADIAHQSRLGRFETYRALGRVVREGIVQVARPSTPAPLSMPRRTDAPSPTSMKPGPRSEPTPLAETVAPSARRRWRGLLIGTASFAITGALGFAWWAITGSAPSLHPGAAVAGVAIPAESIPTRPASLPAAPAPSSTSSRPTSAASSSGAPGARPIARLERDVKASPEDASGSAPPVLSTLPRSSRSAAKSEERSKKRSLSRGAAAAELPATSRSHGSNPAGTGGRPSTAASSASSSGSAADEGDAPSLPDLPESGPGLARATAIAPSSSSRPAVGAASQAPQGLVKAAAVSVAPASTAVAINEFAVRGSLGRSVVEQAVIRAQSDFRACYAGRAAALGRHAGGTARVSLTIDEAGYATGVSAQGAPLPGLDGCLQEAARRIRTRVHPDVGLATVTFAVVFSVDNRAR